MNAKTQLDFTFVDRDWSTRPLYVLPDTEMVSCATHGEFCPNAFYSPREVSEMIAEGIIDCPYCLVEIVGIGE